MFWSYLEQILQKLSAKTIRNTSRGAEPDIFIWGVTGGASFATRGAANRLCRTFRKRPENFWGGHWGDQAKFSRGSGPPWHPPSSAPEHQASGLVEIRVTFSKNSLGTCHTDVPKLFSTTNHGRADGGESVDDPGHPKHGGMPRVKLKNLKCYN